MNKLEVMKKLCLTLNRLQNNWVKKHDYDEWCKDEKARESYRIRCSEINSFKWLERDEDRTRFLKEKS